MRNALAQPHPYLLNRAGGICAVKSFSLVDGKLNVVPEADEPLEGLYQLIYRCEDHPLADIKRGVSSDSTGWSVAEPLSSDEDCDVCYPGLAKLKSQP